MTAASFTRRAGAFLLDGALAALLLTALGPVGGVLGVVHLVLRDALWGGQSLGKRVLSLRVIVRESGAPVGLAESLRRNLVFAVPLIHAAISATVFEGVVLYFDRDALRLGDRMAGTRVVRT